MPTKITEKEKEKRREHRRKRALIDTVEKDNVNLIKNILDKSTNELHQTDLDDVDIEFLRKEWEENTTDSIKKFPSFIEKNEERLEKTDKNIINSSTKK